MVPKKIKQKRLRHPIYDIRHPYMIKSQSITYFAHRLKKFKKIFPLKIFSAEQFEVRIRITPLTAFGGLYGQNGRDGISDTNLGIGIRDNQDTNREESTTVFPKQTFTSFQKGKKAFDPVKGNETKRNTCDKQET